MFDKQKAEGIQGIDLTIVTKRARPEWFVKYVTDPQSLRPGTRMPTIFPNGASPLKETLGGDPAQQVAAMWSFLSDGDKAAVPIGVGGQPIELVADKEPVIYRNFIQGAGVRAIGVGYPQKVNLAFDADDLRPALLWHGAFIDAAKHWTGRGSGFQGPLGDEVLTLAPGPNFAKLQDEKEPWPTKTARELGYRFLGYTLNESRRPVFEYALIGDNAVVDDCRPVAGKRPGMLRTVSLPSGGAGLWFRAAVAKQIKPLADDWFEVDGIYRMRVTCGESRPIVRSGSQGQELIISTTSAKGLTLTQEFAW